MPAITRVRRGVRKFVMEGYSFRSLLKDHNLELLRLFKYAGSGLTKVSCGGPFGKSSVKAVEYFLRFDEQLVVVSNTVTRALQYRFHPVGLGAGNAAGGEV